VKTPEKEKVMRNVFLILLLAIFASNAFTQSNLCLEDFNYVVKRITNDYPGYRDKVNEENIDELRELEMHLRQKLNEYPDSCYYYLNQYAAFFRDRHLRISVNRHNKKSQKDKPEIKRKFYKPDLIKIKSSADSLEDIWFGFRGTFALEKQDDGSYVASALNFRNYDSTQVMFELKPSGGNQFESTVYPPYRNFQPTDGKASMYLNNKVLELHNQTRFVRQSNDRVRDFAFLASYMPKHPNGLNIFPKATYLSDSTFYLRIVTFSSDMAKELVTKHWDEIMARPNLIIDIRGNGGGQDNYYSILADLIYTQPYESKGVEWLATEGIIADWEEAIAEGRIKEGGMEASKALLKAMKENVGEFIVHPHQEGDRVVKRDTVYPYPREVGIIMHGQNASAAEQFLLTAQHSDKVTIFGNENSAGILDYSNITPHELPSGKYNLWLPATRSGRLPENPIDNIGIAPDIIIPLEPKKQLFDRLDSWVYFVQRYLEQN